MGRINKILNNEYYRKLISKINENESDRRFCRHGLNHCLDVARIAYIISLEEKYELDKDIIYAAALLHDIGRADDTDNGKKHHERSCLYAKDILCKCDYSEDEIERILMAINVHNSDGDNSDGLAGLLYRADKLSRKCFDCKAYEECYWEDTIKNNSITY